jgi:DNA-binding transcriptional LysR family regulator
MLDKQAETGHTVQFVGQLPDLEALADFIAVADTGSITVAARTRGRPKQTVSHRLMAIEGALGVRLFDRTTRSLRLTAEGLLLLDRARRVLADIEDTRQMLSARSVSPEGVVRISAPVLLGTTVLGPIAARILAAHPRLRLEIVLSDRRVDLVEEGFDAAIRVGEDDDSSLVGRVLTTAETIVVAAPASVAAHGPPRRPADLAERPCILFGEDSGPAAWTLWSGERSVTVDVTGRLGCSSLMLCLDAAAAGAGYAKVPAFIARPRIDSGAVVRVLPGWHAGRDPLRVVFPSKRLLSARLRTFVDEATDAFRALSL